ncbi:MAG TPA: hypothetical protein VK463_19240, partial [Desulfomonilaceae bacterium]|nr:hypothetical protein [Desulfomonilaceae bacterium]
MAGILKTLLVTTVLFACGCSALPDMRRIQANMDQMVGYMGMMAYNTGQMSAVADKMERKSDTLLANLKDKSSSVERSFQNHSQGVLDNERAMIRNLQG